MTQKHKKPVVLVIAETFRENWYEICEDCGDEFEIEQSEWGDIGLCSYSDNGVVVTLYPSNSSNAPQQQKQKRTISPTIVLIRNFCHYVGSRLGQTPDYRNILYGFYHGNVSLINGIDALIAEIEKPLMYGRLRAIRDKVGNDAFPLITQYYYPEHGQIVITPPVPYVLKVSFPHAGYGKIRVRDNSDTADLASILALHKDYSCAEPFIDSDYELRIVYIAPDYYRVHKRSSISWKVNFGNPNEREDVEMTPRWKRWVDLIVENYPDMYTFCIDAIVDKDGKEYILEFNGSCQGFAPEHGDEDLQHMKKLLINRLREVTNSETPAPLDPIPETTPETQIVNLSNKVEHLQAKINAKNNQIMHLRDNLQQWVDAKREQVPTRKPPYLLIGAIVFCLAVAIVFFHK